MRPSIYTWMPAVALLACGLSTAVLAQPDGGRGGRDGGRDGAVMRGGQQGGIQGQNNPGRIEDLIAPDPFFAWHNRLMQARVGLELGTDEWPRFDAFLRDLGDVVKINERQIWRALGRSRAVASAVPDAHRDVKNLADESRDFTTALDEFAKSYAALLATASPALKQTLQDEYGQALRDSQNGRRRGPQMGGDRASERPADGELREGGRREGSRREGGQGVQGSGSRGP